MMALTLALGRRWDGWTWRAVPGRLLSYHQPGRSEGYRPTFVDELQSAVISQRSQQTFVGFMTGEW